MFYDISSKYERDIQKSLNDERSLVLLGCRADADIKHLNNKIKQLKADKEKLMTAIVKIINWKDSILADYDDEYSVYLKEDFENLEKFYNEVKEQ